MNTTEEPIMTGTYTPSAAITETTSLLVESSSMLERLQRQEEQRSRQRQTSCTSNTRAEEARELLRYLGGWKSLAFALMGLTWGMLIMYVYDNREISSPPTPHFYYHEERRNEFFLPHGYLRDPEFVLPVVTEVPPRKPEVLGIKEGRWLTSKYTHFQGLGFQIYTGGAPGYLEDDDDGDDSRSSSKNESENKERSSKERHHNDECVGLHSYGHIQGELQCYLGHKDPVKDARHRLQIMRDAVERAYEQSLHDDDPKTLKVFIAPEFFWRGKNGAYLFANETLQEKLRAQGDPSAECRAVCQILRGLENLVADAKYADWLFVFGTVIASETLPQGDEYDYLFYNFAPVYKGYDPAKSTPAGKRFLVPKRYVSDIDFLTPRRNFNDTIAKELRPFDSQLAAEYDEHYDNDTTVFNPFDLSQTKYDYEVWTQYKEELSNKGYAIIEYNWFVMDDIVFTIEICLDHLHRSALDSYTANVVTGSKLVIPSGSSSSTSEELEYVPIPAHQAQISLVSSAGMVVMPSSLALAQNGTILLQDGMDNTPSRMFWESGSSSCARSNKGLAFEGGSEAVQRVAFLSPTEVVFDYKVRNEYQTYDLYPSTDVVQCALKGSFSTKVYDPQVLVYQPIEIASIN
jgi:hypothetical protein